MALGVFVGWPDVDQPRRVARNRIVASILTTRSEDSMMMEYITKKEFMANMTEDKIKEIRAMIAAETNPAMIAAINAINASHAAAVGHRGLVQLVACA